VLVILDNHVVAMTGFQPTGGYTVSTSNNNQQKVSIFELVKACSVAYVCEVDPYNQSQFRQLIRRAYKISKEENSISVVIASHSCILNDAEALYTTKIGIKEYYRNQLYENA